MRIDMKVTGNLGICSYYLTIGWQICRQSFHNLAIAFCKESIKRCKWCHEEVKFFSSFSMSYSTCSHHQTIPNLGSEWERLSHVTIETRQLLHKVFSLWYDMIWKIWEIFSTLKELLRILTSTLRKKKDPKWCLRGIVSLSTTVRATIWSRVTVFALI